MSLTEHDPAVVEIVADGITLPYLSASNQAELDAENILDRLEGQGYRFVSEGHALIGGKVVRLEAAKYGDGEPITQFGTPLYVAIREGEG